MRLSHSLLALAVTPLAWLSTASAQTPPDESMPGTTSVPSHVQVQVHVQPVPVAPAPSIPTTIQPVAPPPVATQPYAIPPVLEPPQSPAYGSMYAQPTVPATPTAMPSGAVLLLPSELMLSSKGSWERRGNELFLRHSGTPGSRRSGLITGGIVLLSVAYTPALIMGGLVTLFEGPTGTGSSLFLPVAGPFLSGLCALARCDGNFLGTSGSQTWAWTWMFLDGAAQVAGLAMIIAGARSRPKDNGSFLERVHILPYSTQNGGGVTVSGRF